MLGIELIHASKRGPGQDIPNSESYIYVQYSHNKYCVVWMCLDNIAPSRKAGSQYAITMNKYREEYTVVLGPSNISCVTKYYL